MFEDGTVLDNVDIILFAAGYFPDYDIVDIPGITGKSTALNQNKSTDFGRKLSLVEIRPQSQWRIQSWGGGGGGGARSTQIYLISNKISEILAKEGV